MSHVIEVKSLRIDYDETTAVHDLTFNIEKGQIYGFVGPNGAGKTSTIKAIAGVLEPTFGEIYLCGLDLETRRQEALVRLGYMPDFPPVYESLKTWEYLDVFAAAYGIDADARPKKVGEWLEKVSLSGKREELVKTLSRGMRQRLVLAKTLLPVPEILLLDEPASGLDPAARRQMRDLLKEAAQGGATILISSHILSELSDFCDAVGILEKGKLVVSGSLEEIRRRVGSAQKLVIKFLDHEHSVNAFWAQVDQWQIPRSFVAEENGTFRIEFPHDEAAGTEFLNQLVARGARVKHFELESDDIEDIFFKVGAKEVS